MTDDLSNSQSMKKKESDEVFKFDPNDEFYLAMPMCQLVHYRHAAVICGVIEAFLLLGGVFSFYGLHRNASLNSVWSFILITVILFIACTTTAIMIYGIATEKPKFLIPQIKFLHIEIGLFLFGAAISITSMSLGIEWTHFIFSSIVSVPQMELNFGPIWPFNVAIVSFSGAAIGIWMEVIVQGCYDYLLDKMYFESALAPPPYIQMGLVGRS